MAQYFGVFGWITAWSFILAMGNYIVKWGNKKVVSKMKPQDTTFVKTYRVVMKFLIKYHRLFGSIAVVSVACHGGIALSYGMLNPAGMLSSILMFSVAGLGMYGALTKKKPNGAWFMLHRGLAAAMLLTIAYHIGAR